MTAMMANETTADESRRKNIAAMGEHASSIYSQLWQEVAVSDLELKTKVSNSVKVALLASEFCRDWRNRHIAHRDLDLALKRGANPLEPASRLKVQEALDSLANVLNVMSQHFFDSSTVFDLNLRSGGGPGGAMSLLYVIDFGLKAEKSRRERLKSGHFDPNDYRPRDL